jgi:hypothetical protein
MRHFLLLLSLSLLALNLWASECERDKKKFCQDVVPGKGQLARCLEQYQDQLSSGCLKEMANFKQKTAKKNPCFEDLAEYCSSIPTQGKRLEYCLLNYESKLSANCSKDFRKKKVALISKDECAQDTVNHCYSTLSGPSEGVFRCLIQNREKLKPLCKVKVDSQVAIKRKKNPCFDETQKLCPKELSLHEIHSCMKKNLTKLSLQCKKVVNEEIKRDEANPCHADLRQHCRKGISVSEQHRCLALNENHLSNSCRQFRSREAEKITKIIRACEKDRLKLCSKVAMENGKVMECLKKNISSVSNECKSLIK